MFKQDITLAAIVVGAILATAGSAGAALVQITQKTIYPDGNWVLDTYPDPTAFIHGDLTGDAVDEFDPYVAVVSGTSAFLTDLPNNQIYANAWGSTTDRYTWVYDRQDNVDNAKDQETTPRVAYSEALIDMSFTDVRINGGALTQGQLEVYALGLGPGWALYNYSVVIERLIFDDADPAGALVPSTISAAEDSYPEWVPEPTTLALLALGSLGLAALRRRRK